MSNLCIIPARGGSKRIPRKNIRDFHGKPVISYSIQAALSSGLFADVMVSTDDEEIADVAIKYGANVPFLRSPATSDDFATTADVLVEVLAAYKDKGASYENVCCIYPCAPFVSSELLEQGLQLLIDNKFLTVFPIVIYETPIQRALQVQNGKVSFVLPEYALTRSQDLESRYHDAGQFYWLRVQDFLRSPQLITDNSGGLVRSSLEVQDIDNETDWEVAELKYKLFRSGEKEGI